MSDGLRARRSPLVAGNWKMHGLRANLATIGEVCAAVSAGAAGKAEVVICPPATLLMAASPTCGDSLVALGGQDCHPEPYGPYTGEISAEMLKDAGADYVILGHSERRIDHHEHDLLVRLKAKAALRAGLAPIICVGETRVEREAGEALPIVAAQLEGSVPEKADPEGIIIAYEPIWAIGTGLTPTPEDVAEMHQFIRSRMDQILCGSGEAIRILYGGSVKPANAPELMTVENVDGALVGGASLTAAEFMAIVGVFKAS